MSTRQHTTPAGATSPASTTASARRAPVVAVVGGGLVGLSCAWRLARRGAAVTVLDPTPGRGASWAAAGMVAPVTEATYGEEHLLELGLAAAARWPGFARELTQDSGRESGLRDGGTLVVGHDSGDAAELARFAEHLDRLALPVQRLTARECRRLEPMLAPDVRGGLLAADRSVHNRDTVAALLAACARVGVALREELVAEVVVADGAAVGVRLGPGELVRADTVVVAAGAWTRELPGLGADAPPVRPVRGTILRLRTPEDYRRAGGVLSRTLRGTVAGAHVYLVPREDGEVVVGATSDEAGFDDRATAGGVWELLRDARALLPVVSELTFVEAWSGLRPVAPDNAPVVGATSTAGLVLATGHGRNGVLLSPLTADAVTSLILDGEVPAPWQDFSPQRLRTAAVAS